MAVSEPMVLGYDSAWKGLLGLSRRSWLLRYAIVATVVGLTLAVKMLVPSLAGDHTALLFFLPAVLISAIVGGMVPGLVATFVSAVACDYLLVVPYSLLLQEADYNRQLGGFVIEGAVVSVLGAGLVRSRRQVEDFLMLARQSEERYRSAFDNVLVGAAHTSAAGRFLKTNKRLCEITGFPEEELLELTMWDLVHPDDLGEEDFERVRAVLADGSDTFSAEKRCVRRDGSIALLELTATPAGGPAPDRRYLVVVAHDVTERKKAEEEMRSLRMALERRLQRQSAQVHTSLQEAEDSEEMLRISLKRFTSLVRNASDIITILHPGGSIAYHSPAIERVLGYEERDLIGENMADRVHPEDAERLRDALEKSKSGTCTVEFRFRHRNGAWRHLEAIVNDLSGEPGVEGIVMNSREVTERVRAEEALRKSERLYRTVVEQAAESIFIVDKETRQVLEANTALQHSLGYTSQEARRLTIYDIVLHDHESIDGKADGGPEDERIFSGERRYRRKDGSLADVEVNANTVSYGDREAMCVVAHDVTERKRVEGELRESLGVLLALREAGQVLGSTLEPAEVVSRLLDIMRQVSQLTATVISMQGAQGNVQAWRSSGLAGLPEGSRYLLEAKEARQAALDGKRTIVRLSDAGQDGLVGVFFPLETRTGVVGVLEAYGSGSLAREDTIEILDSLTSQAASALEHAKLYQALGEREQRLQDLVGRLLSAQEEERRRVSYEVHDGLAQIAVAAHQHLQAFARRYSPETEKGRKDLERVLRLVRATVSDARRIIADLRPTTLDDFGLSATLAIAAQTLEEEGYEVEYEENLGGVRLPDAVEIALFRVVQEALTNMRKHAETLRVCITLGRGEGHAWVGVRDFGIGFDQSAHVVESGPGERVGLVGMRERLGMMGGVLEVQSTPGEGTSISATVPLEEAL